MSSQKPMKPIEERRIFRYTRADGWGYTMSQVDVVAGVEKGNVRCLYFDTPGFHSNTRTDSCFVTIGHEDVESIENAMLSRLDVCGYKEIEFPVVLDGVINTFEFTPGNSPSNVITVFNISAFREGRNVAIVGKPPYKGREVLKLYDEISKILSDNGVSQKYLSLDSLPILYKK